MNILPIEPIHSKTSANAFLIGTILNHAQQADRCWRAPYVLEERMGSLDPTVISNTPPASLAHIFAASPSIHRFPSVMSRYIQGACMLLLQKYDGDARKIWSPARTASELLMLLLEFPGIGKRKAEVTLFLLTVELNVTVLDDGTQIDMANTCKKLTERFHPVSTPILKPMTKAPV